MADHPFNTDISGLELLPGAAEGLQVLWNLGYDLVVVSNQPGVALGFFPERDITRIARALAERFAQAKVPLAGFYYCPHHPQGTVLYYARDCLCRKPEPGLLIGASRELRLDLARSWMVSDALDDIEAGNRAGCRSLLVQPDDETEWEAGEERNPFAIARDLARAAAFIKNVERPAA